MTPSTTANSLWLVARAAAAAYHVIANQNNPSGRRDLPVAQAVAELCGPVLANRNIRISIDARSHPATYTIFDDEGTAFPRPYNELEAWSDSFMPEQWDHSPLKAQLAAALCDLE